MKHLSIPTIQVSARSQQAPALMATEARWQSRTPLAMFGKIVARK